MANVGDKVKITINDQNGHSEEGVLMPSSDENAVIIKLSNGYNIGFEKAKVSEIVVLEAADTSGAGANDVLKVQKKSSLPDVVILHTGGTIASKVDYKTGGVVAKFTAQDLINMVPEISGIANIRTQMVFNMMSEDMDLKHYQVLAEAICSLAHSGVKGIIVGHGTDTLAQTSAMISFMLDNLPVPVLFVGSQRSSDRGSSDAAMNLICAARFIAETDFAGVAVCMHENSNDNTCLVLPGTKTRKMHTSRRDAFKAVNAKAIARVSYPVGAVEYIDNEYLRSSDVKGDLVCLANLSDKVGILKTYPGIKPEVIRFYKEHGYKGLIIEGTGMGHAPTNSEANKANLSALSELIESGCVVGVTSNCINGAVHEHIYSNTRRLADIGVVFCHDMFTETAVMKLIWLLGNFDAAETKKMLCENLRGEIGEKAAYEETFTTE